MAITSGFFDSVDGDRKYNAEQMSAIFNGIINDGVFQSIGDAFAVTANSGYTVNVGSGRAWFNSTWVNNDAILPLTLDAPNALLNRYDAVIIEINRNEDVRSATITVKKGTEAAEAKWPSMTRSNGLYQYPVAYIYRRAGSASITQANIQYWVGNGKVPFVTAILETTNTDNMLAQWKAEWDEWYASVSDNWNAWYADTTNQATADINTWETAIKSEFDMWFASLEAVLDGDTAASLASAIANLRTRDRVFTATLLADGWSGDATNGYTQTVTCEGGILATDTVEGPIGVFTGNKDQDILLREGFDILCEAGNTCEVLNGQIKWTCYDVKPTVDLTFWLRYISGTPVDW